MWNGGNTLSKLLASQVRVLTGHACIQICQLVTDVSRLSGHPIYSTVLFNVSVGEEKGLGPRDGYDKDSGTRLTRA